MQDQGLISLDKVFALVAVPHVILVKSLGLIVFLKAIIKGNAVPLPFLGLLRTILLLFCAYFDHSCRIEEHLEQVTLDLTVPYDLEPELLPSRGELIAEQSVIGLVVELLHLLLNCYLRAVRDLNTFTTLRRFSHFQRVRHVFNVEI